MTSLPDNTEKNGPPLPQSLRIDQASRRVLLGVIGSDRGALMQAAPATRILDTLGVGIRVFVMPLSGTGKLAEWCSELRAAGGIALWIIVTDSLEIVHRAAALELELPIFCQAAGSNGADIEKQLLGRMSEISAAMLPAGRMREAAMTFATHAALRDAEIESRLQAMRNSAALAAQKNSDYIATRIQEVTPVPETAPRAQSDTADQQWLERNKVDLLKPRVKSKPDKQQPGKETKKAFDYSVQLRQVLNSAKEIAAAYRNPQVTPEHLLAAIIDTPEAAAHHLLQNAGVNLENLAGHLMPHFPPPHDSDVTGMFSMADSTWTILEQARIVARERQRSCLTTLDFFEAMALRTTSGAASALWEAGLVAVQLSEAIGRTDAEAEYASVKKNEEPEPTGVDPDAARDMQARLGKSAVEENEAPQPQGYSPEPTPDPQILRCSSDHPDIEVVETVADALLEGRLVAFPMDTMYALAADATNPAAVMRLREAALSNASRPVGALIHSTGQLKHLVKNVSNEVMKMLEELWPGPLTVVFDRHPHRFAHLSSEATLGLRIPADYLSLAILSTVGRPLATTSVRIDEGERAGQIAERLAGVADFVIDTGEPAGDTMTTVLSVAGDTKRIIRQGATQASTIQAHFEKRDP